MASKVSRSKAKTAERSEGNKPAKKKSSHGGPHAFWRGNLKLSLVSCPIMVFPATESAATIRFNLINPKTNHRIRMETHDAETGAEIQRSDLVKGYQYEKGKYVIMEDMPLITDGTGTLVPINV
jgi:DNA end-binding protein Ku